MLSKTWAGLVFSWLVSAIVLPFIIGGLVVFMPFVKEWTKSITLYDLVTEIFWWYAISMAIIGSTTFIGTEEGDKTPSKLISLLGIIILIALIIGRFTM